MIPDLSIRAGGSGCASGDALRGAETVAPNRGGRSGGAAREFAPVGCEFWISSRHAQRIEAVSNRIAAIVCSRSRTRLRSAHSLGRHPAGGAGVPLAGRAGSVQQHVRVKERQRGYDEATFIESFVILNAAGGECLEDFERLREDAGLAELIGHEMPSPEAAWNFLRAFHEEKKI